MFCSYCRALNADDAQFCSACGRDLTPSSGRRQTPDPMEYGQTELGLVIGSCLLQRYRIQQTIGVGGMGRVYLAEDEKLKMPVAIKVMREVLSRDPGSVARLMAEARHAMRLADPHIVRVHNFEDDGIVKFLVMEYVEGETLAHRIAMRGRLSEDEMRAIGIAMCKGLEHAHEKGVIHRDLKPANVLLGKDGAIKIADFGIARACRDSVSRLTSQKDDSGTLPYMSPEQIMGESSEATDVYALGAVLYEMLSGAPPFHTGDITAQIREKAPLPLPGISPGLSALVMRCLEKNPAARFARVRDLREELDGNAERRRQEELRRQNEERAHSERRAEDEWRQRAEDDRRRRAADEARRQAEEVQRRNTAEEERLRNRNARQELARRARTLLGVAVRRSGRWLAWTAAAIVVLALLLGFVYLYPHIQSGYLAAKDIPVLADAKEPASRAVGTLWRSPVDGRDMVWIEPGSLSMGSWEALWKNLELEVTPHRVRIERGFWLDTAEVTYEAYRRFILANPQWQKDRIEARHHDGDYLKDWNGNEFPYGLGQYPVIFVSWRAARAYAEWAGKRLPTEAEWEYACRAGAGSAYWWGNSFDASRANANDRGSLPADERRRNPWGLYDMSGNLWEMTSSLFRPYPYRSDDGREDLKVEGVRALRGGGWESPPEVLRSGYRGATNEKTCSKAYGFRCAR